MALNAEDYMLFDESDFSNIIGETMATKLSDRGINDYPTYFITYASQMIMLYIREHTSLNIYKIYNEETGEYDIKLGLAKIDNKVIYEVNITEDQLNILKLACVYQADYIIDNGSTERMTAMGMVNRSNKYDKKDLKEFEICSMSKSLLDNAGLSYQGIGGGLYVKFK